MTRNFLHLVMILCLLVVMDYRFIENTIHEVLGLSTVLLFIIHNALNRYWYTAIGKGKMSLLRILITITNLLLFIIILLVTISGVLISQTVFSSFSISGNLWAHELHTFATNLGFILIAIHLGLHWNGLWEKLYRWLRINRTSYSYIILSRIASMLIIVYGIYASFTRNVGSKLLLQHVFNEWAAQPSLVGFIVDYAAIMGCYAVITYFLTQILQKAKS